MNDGDVEDEWIEESGRNASQDEAWICL